MPKSVPEIQALLHMSEGTDLDFKSTQYAFAGEGSEDVKSKLLKDILTLANSYRAGDAVILVGVEEVKGQRARISGIAQTIDDASLQEFVNKKLARRLEFSYRELQIEGKQIGIFEIPKQKRPFYTVKKYGRVHPNVVYFRVGSSSKEATPDEIVEMGLADYQAADRPMLTVSLFDFDRRAILGPHASMKPVRAEMPRRNEIPDLRGPDDLWNLRSAFDRLDRDFYRESADFFKRELASCRFDFLVRNDGPCAAVDVRLRCEIRVNGASVQVYDVDEKPTMPRSRLLPVVPGLARNAFRTPDVRVDRVQDEWLIDARLEKVHAGASESTSCGFWVECGESARIEILARITADNLPEPETQSLLIDVAPTVQTYSVDDIVELAHAAEGD
ncbi:MAG TPA: ATP-binding protein [Phycisphaerae bacterium]|nr:ATP-binding protein [Phycisphaerae bacterium]